MQVGEIAQLCRYLPAQLVSTEVEVTDPASAVSADAVPLVDRLLTQPVGIVVPSLAAHGVVKGNQGGPFHGFAKRQTDIGNIKGLVPGYSQWHAPGKPVPVEDQRFQTVEVAELRRQTTFQVVPAEIQNPQSFDAAQLGRNLSTQPVVVEV